MKSTQFVYWLQGAFELNDEETINEKKLIVIKNNFAEKLIELVFYF